MSTFGPRYPPPLQQAINHAELFAEYLANAEAREHLSDDRAVAWITGRAEELEAVITCLVDDWRQGRLSLEAVAHSVSAYVRAMHDGAEVYLGVGPEFDCCSADVAVTVPLTPYQEAVTVHVEPSAQKTTNDTLVDPSALLAELAHKHDE
jgi:hypothetical protein